MPHTPIPDGWPCYMKQLGINLQRNRIKAGLSQENVAYSANLSRFTYQQLEKGESRPGSPANPSLLNILAIAQVLHVSLDTILPDNLPDLHA